MLGTAKLKCLNLISGFAAVCHGTAEHIAAKIWITSIWTIGRGPCVAAGGPVCHWQDYCVLAWFEDIDKRQVCPRRTLTDPAQDHLAIRERQLQILIVSTEATEAVGCC